MDRCVLVFAVTALGGCYLSHDPDPPAPDEVRVEEVCGDGVDQDRDGVDPPCPADVCPTGTTVDHAIDLDFPDPGGCPWGDGDNGRVRDGVYRARTEQVETLGLPAGAVLCSLRVEAAEQEITFDDELIVTFADAVVVESFRPEGIFEMPDGIPRYRWSDLQGRHLGENDGVFCLGPEGGCALPDSETRGRFTLELGGTTGEQLGEIAIARGSAEVTVVTTGDNNRDGDCRHTPFTLRVTATIVPATP